MEDKKKNAIIMLFITPSIYYISGVVLKDING